MVVDDLMSIFSGLPLLGEAIIMCNGNDGVRSHLRDMEKCKDVKGRYQIVKTWQSWTTTVICSISSRSSPVRINGN